MTLLDPVIVLIIDGIIIVIDYWLILMTRLMTVL